VRIDAKCQSRHFALGKTASFFAGRSPRHRSQTFRLGRDTVPDIAADMIPLGTGQMTNAMVTQRLKAIRRTKLYDLFAAAPLIVWYVYCAAQMLPSLANQIALVKMFIQTDPSVLPATLVLSTVSHCTTFRSEPH
jgi:hypothetical protein